MRLSRRSLVQIAAIVLGGAIVVAGPALRVPAYAAQSAARITTTDLGGATLFQGDGGNVIALPGPDGALMVDAGLAANAEALLAEVKKATGAARINTLINTHWHPEVTGANEAVGKAGGVIVAHEKTKLMVSHTVYSAIGFKSPVLPLPDVARPTKTVRLDGTMDFAGQQIQYGYMPAAHTDGDLYVFFPKLNLLAVGGVISAQGWPLLDYKNGAWLGGRVRALQSLAKVVKPDTRVIASDGRMLTGADIARQREMFDKMFSTMIGYLNMGMGPEDAALKRPLKAYESEYGDSASFTYDALRSMMIAYVPD